MIRLTPEEMKAKKDEREAIIGACLRENSGFAKIYPHLDKRHHWLFCKLWNQPKTLSKTERIKAKCVDCSGYQTEEVRNCNVKSCALWEIRPYQ